MTGNIVDDLIEMQDEPIVSEENEGLLQQIIAITKTSEFLPMNLTEEKLDDYNQAIKWWLKAIEG